jgi:hypothetical protein
LHHAAALLLATLIGGCGEEMPPYEELPLRDALSAAPEVLASMPEESRREVARRLEEARAAEDDDPTPIATDEEGPGIGGLVRGGDATREASGKDALVLARIEPLPEGLALAPMDAEVAEGPRALPTRLEGIPSATTVAMEEAALQGRAGAILHDMALRTDAQELVRTTGIPAGVVAMDHTLYVNASWLVAMSALEPKAAAPPAGGGMFAPPRVPQSVKHNPYDLPRSVELCASEVIGVCSCATVSQCDHEPTDKTFTDGQAECTWVNSDPVNASALCVLALMSIEGVRECVQRGGAECAQIPVTTREQAVAFASDPGCMSVLDSCLAFGQPSPPISGTGGGCGSGNSNGCDSCDGEDCDGDGCSSDLSSCNDDCSECNQNCSDCNQNCSDCNQNANNSTCGACGSSRCSVRPEQPRGAPSSEPPAGTLFMLAAPAMFLLRRARRRP